MKRGIAILLLVFYLGLITEFYQLLKIPVLIEHFSEHQSLKNNLSFLNFLKMHYSKNNDHDGDSEKDNKLPFKSHSFYNNHVVSVSFISINSAKAQTPITLKTAIEIVKKQK